VNLGVAGTANRQHSGGLVLADHRQADAVEVRCDMAWSAAEISDWPRGCVAYLLSEGREQAALDRPVIQHVPELVSVEGCDRIVGRAGSKQIGL
jgi:hypothetical protein